MRNLKRALSLALAAVMVLGMMVIGAGAVSIDDFSDKDKIVNTEAVTTMVSLGVINGKDDGSYDPTGIVTRAEMAKLIAVTLNGGKDPTLGSITADFTDTKGHWAESYIAYVSSLGIIDGRGDGTFGPNDQVTGAQAAKMILTMLGYRSDIEGFTGPTWAINVQTKGNDIDLFADMLINPDEGLTRDDTAQMLYNGVQSWMVEYRNLEGSYDGIVYPQPLNGTKANSTVLLEKFKVAKVEGVVQATSLIAMENVSTTVEGKTRLTDIVYNGEKWGNYNNQNQWVPAEVTYPIAIDSEYLGYRVVIYVKGLNDLSPNATSMEVVGSYIVSDDNTVVTTTGRLAKTSDVKDALKGSGISMPTNDPARVYITDDTTLWGTTDGKQAMPGVTQKFIDNNGDGSVDFVVQLNPGLTKVNTYNDKDEVMNLAGIGSVDFVDVVEPENVAQGDYVLVYNYDGTYVLKAVETVSGTVSAFVSNASYPELSKITVDETNYGWGAGKNLAPDLLDVDNTPGANLDDLVDGTYTLYLDPNGNMLGYVEDEGVIGNYAVITGVNKTGTTSQFYSAEVKVILADGSTGKYDVNLLASANKCGIPGANNNAKEGNMLNALDGMIDTVVSYALDGNTITIIDPDVATDSYHGTEHTNSAKNELVVKNSTAGYVFDDGTLMADDRTVFFFKDNNGSYSVVNGLSKVRASGLKADTGTVSSAIYYQPNGNYTKAARAIFVDVDATFVSNSNYAFISGNYTRTTEGNDTVYSYPVVGEDGVASTLKTKTQVGGSYKNKVHEYQLDGNYVNFGSDDKIVNTKVIIGVGSNSITVADADNVNAGIASYPTSGAKIWNVEDTDTIFETSFQLNDKVALVLDEDYKVQTGFVYDRLDGEMIAKPTTASTMTESAGTLDDADGKALNPAGELSVLRDGGTIYWNGATASATLKFQPVLTSATMGGTVSAKYSIDGAADADYVYASGIVITASATGNDVNTTHEIKLTISEKDNNGNSLLNDCVITYTVVINGAKAAEPTKVELASGTATVDSTPVALSATEKKTAEIKTTPFTDGQNVVFNVTPSTSKVESITLNGATYNPGDAVKVVAGTTTYTLVIKVSEANKVTTTYTYVVDLTAKQAEATAPTKVEVAAKGSGDTATVAGGPVTLANKGADKDNAVKLTSYSDSADTVKIDVTGGEGNVITLKNNNTGITTTYTSGADIVVADSGDGTASYTLTIVSSATNKAPVTSIYNITFTLEA
mgnify:CR=1 FL=1